MSATAGAPFFLMSTATFLRHAKEYLRASVSPETVDQARELPTALIERDRALAEDTMASLRRTQEYRRMLERELRAAAAEENRLLEIEHEVETSGSEARLDDLQAWRAQRQAAHEARMTAEARSRELSEEEARLLRRLTALMGTSTPSLGGHSL